MSPSFHSVQGDFFFSCSVLLLYAVPCAAYSVSVSAVEILFASKISMIKQESSWQRVRYYLELVLVKMFTN